MYGTVARFRLKPGMREQLADEARRMAAQEQPAIPGFVAQYVYQLDQDPDELYLAVVFTSRETYHANAVSPEQNARYEQMAALMAGPPEWHDGEILFTYPPQG